MSDFLLSDQDVSQLVRLLSDVVLKKGSIEEKKSYLLERLSSVIHANCWVWAPIKPSHTGGKAVAVEYTIGGFTPERLSAYLEAIEHPDMKALNAPFYEVLSQSNRLATRTRQQLDPANLFSHSAVYEHWERAEIAEILLSGMPLEGGNISLIGFYRKTGSQAFTAREARIAHIVLSEVTWLHASAFPELKTQHQFDYSKLSSRQRTVLILLLEGHGRKQMATYLQISENTVAGYIKEIYRLYKVQSQPELLRLFRVGNGGDNSSPQWRE